MNAMQASWTHGKILIPGKGVGCPAPARMPAAAFTMSKHLWGRFALDEDRNLYLMRERELYDAWERGLDHFRQENLHFQQGVRAAICTQFGLEGSMLADELLETRTYRILGGLIGSHESDILPAFLNAADRISARKRR